jgi:integrase
VSAGDATVLAVAPRRKTTRQRGSYRWRSPGAVELRVWDRETKRHQTRNVQVASEREARDELAAFVAEVLDGKVPTSPKTITVAQVGEKWWERKAKLGRAGDASLAQSKWALGHLVSKIGGRKVRNIRGVDLEDAYAALLADGLSPKSVSHVSGVAHQVFEYARKRDYIRTNPARDVEERPKRTDGAVSAPEDEDVAAFLLAAQEHDYSLFSYLIVSAATGGRRSEVLGLRRKDILWDNGQVWFRKSVVKRRLPDGGAPALIVKDSMKSEAGRRRVAVGEGVLGVLSEHLRRLDADLEPAGLSFPEDGFLYGHDPVGKTPYHPDTVNKRFRDLARKTGITGVTPHGLRHYAATQVAPYLTETEMMGRFGWKTPLMVKRYAEYRAARDAEAAGVMDRVLELEPKYRPTLTAVE